MITPLPRLRLVTVLASLAAAIAYPLAAADNPVHTAPPREAVNPLYEGKTDAASLAPLQAWVAQRCADGTCTVEQLQRELQAALTDIHERSKSGHRIIMDDIKAARTARENLLKEIAAAKATGQPLRALAEKVASLPAIPTARIWGDPHVDQKPTATTTTASSKRPASLPASASSSETTAASHTVTTTATSSAAAAPGAAGDLDELAAKLKADLATLTSLAQQTQGDLQLATTRLQRATAALSQQAKAMHDTAKNAISNMKS
ncbi:MAG: hypothetical protein IAE82_10295 [Opitutaceae bacterium]|nr:hypothetical protein [Opitutaceae bacterium]